MGLEPGKCKCRPFQNSVCGCLARAQEKKEETPFFCFLSPPCPAGEGLLSSRSQALPMPWGIITDLFLVSFKLHLWRVPSLPGKMLECTGSGFCLPGLTVTWSGWVWHLHLKRSPNLCFLLLPTQPQPMKYAHVG